MKNLLWSFISCGVILLIADIIYFIISKEHMIGKHIWLIPYSAGMTWYMVKIRIDKRFK